MAWTAFEILINFYQAFLVLHYIRQCFAYPKKNYMADGLLLLSFTIYLSIYLFWPSFPLSQQLIYIFPVAHVFLLSSEPKISAVYWLLVLILMMNLVSVLTYPIFDLLPDLFHFEFASDLFKRLLRIAATNVAMFFILELIIRLKKKSSYPRSSSYVIFILLLGIIFVTEETIFTLYVHFRTGTAMQFFIIYVGLILCAILFVFLFHSVANDTERENRYQAEISLLNLTKQHQLELSKIYNELIERQHDYKNHLQILQQLIGTSNGLNAQNYLNAMVEDSHEEMIVTGSSEIDALLTVKCKFMREKGIQFLYTPYPLASLPISTSDFCSIVANLLDNAIEGVLRIPEPHEQATIHLSFSRSWDMFYIYCENPCNPSTIIREKENFISSKKEHEPGWHGIGLHSINSIAFRAEGRTEFVVEQEMFYAKVVLPYPKERRQPS